MSTLSSLTNKYGTLTNEETDWLHLLIGDWQVISDLSFADLVLWLPTFDGQFIAIAHARPSTGATVYTHDVVGRMVPEDFAALVHGAYESKEIITADQTRWDGSFAIQDEAVPVIRQGRVIGVLARQTHLGTSRSPDPLEINYVEAADDILGMVSRGEFPHVDAATGQRRGAPRVGDGLVRLNGEGEVKYASPNAISAFHRLGVTGEIVGRTIAEVITPFIEESGEVDESLPVVVLGRAAWRTDVDASGVILSLRALPVTEKGKRTGAVLLVRDVTELRRRERELMTKDATIREIHHRVKNNLQTVAALLRLQARRTESDETRQALGEAMRRVATIASVHEALSQTINEVVDFDSVFGRTLRLAVDVATRSEAPINYIRTGKFGDVPAKDASALAVVLTELVANAVEHGLVKTGGTVTIDSERKGKVLIITVQDDGEGFSGEPSGLGTQIVRTLVASELDGEIRWEPGEPGGTKVVLMLRIDEASANTWV